MSEIEKKTFWVTPDGQHHVSLEAAEKSLARNALAETVAKYLGRAGRVEEAADISYPLADYLMEAYILVPREEVVARPSDDLGPVS